ncbi:MAG: VCBS repeat-containing protein [Planctomycetota bacterium]
MPRVLTSVPVRRSLALAGALAAGIPSFAACVGAPRPPTHFELHGQPVPVGPMPGGLVLADMDADGDLDAVVVCGPCCGRDPVPESGHLRVLLNDGGGTLRPLGGRIRLGETATGGDVGDVNGDGILDVVAHHHLSYRIAVLLGVGDGRLAEPRYVEMHRGGSPHVHALRLADVDNDGDLDVLATLVDDHAMAVLLGDGAGGFAPALGQPYFAHRHPYAGLRVADLNADGNLDAVMTDVRGNGMTVLLGSGTGMFSPRNGFDLNTTMPIASAERPMSCDLGDLDGDGDLDALAFIDESPMVIRLENTGGGMFVEAGDPIIDLRTPSVGGRLVDVSGDGLLDVVASGTASRRVAVCFGEPGGGFSPAMHVDAGGRSPGVAVGDMDGDGRPDIVTANFDSGTVSVLRNVGPRG